MNASYAYVFEDNEKEYLFSSEDDVVRGFIWGLPPEIITEGEKGTFIGNEIESKGEQVTFFIDKIFNVRSTIGYEFKNDKLWRVKVFNEKKYHDPQDRIEDLLKIQNYFTERYGDPIQENFFWKNNEQRNTVDNWGWALYRGNLAIEMLWQTVDSNIRISLKSPEPLDPEFIIIFEDKKMMDSLYVIELEGQKPEPLIPTIEFDQ